VSAFRVLLVDDDTFFLKVYGGFLVSHGFEVDTCETAGAALARDDSGELAMHGYRGLLEAASLPMAWNPAHSSIGTELTVGLPVLTRRDVTAPSRQAEHGEAMLVPLSKDGRVLGLVALFDKLGGGFTTDDTARARIVGECAVTAVAHARRFRALERVGLRDPATTAYNMTYFVDYLGRELHKARRYRRSFSLVQVTIDSAPALRQSISAEAHREAMRQIVLAVSSVLRDIDVLAQVSEGELYLLSPETDFLGGLAFARAARDALRDNAFLADLDRRHPVTISFGPAAFPRDGDDVDQLFAACRRRIDEARRSIFRRLHLEDVDFWGAVELLVGDARLYSGAEVEPTRAITVTEDDKGLSRHHVFPQGFGELVRGEVLSEAVRQAHSSGWLFLGGASSRASDEMVRQLRSLEASALRTYVLSADTSGALADLPHVTTVSGGDVLRRHEVVLMLAEHSAYALLARRRDDGRLTGYHTADWTLVEGLIGKLQDAYHLQRGAA
jgi:diguanylate cyclase (GGDEF)-like protein